VPEKVAQLNSKGSKKVPVNTILIGGELVGVFKSARWTRSAAKENRVDRHLLRSLAVELSDLLRHFRGRPRS